MSGLDYERLVLAAGPVGIMQAAFDISQEYLKTREQFGRPIGSFQMMQEKIAIMYTKLQASRSMLYSCSKMVD
jgi:isovaleryl-CoA dehydrogenase